VALAFLSKAPSVFLIPKASRLEHVEDNAGSMALTLSSSDLERIEAAFPRGPKPSRLPMI
jgi:diketogulonate reductase-like aldo/keto reductase